MPGADQVDLYLSDGYYGYGYDTDYSNGNANVSVNVNIGNGWGGYYDPWYSGWYGGWYGGWYDPWIYSPARYWGYGRPSASAGVGAVSTPATGARLGAGGLVIGAVDIGVALGGIITIMQHRIIVLMQVVQLLMQIVIEVAEVEMVVRLIGSLRVIDTIMAQPLL